MTGENQIGSDTFDNGSDIIQITDDEIVVIENISVETSDNGRAVGEFVIILSRLKYFRSTTISELVIDVIRPSKK